MTTSAAYYRGPGERLISAEGIARISLLARLYVWSIVLEPLLLFVLFEAATTGFTANVSKMLQLVVLGALSLKFLGAYLKKGLFAVRLVNLSSPIYRDFRNYLVLAALAGMLGAMSGAYDVPFQYAYTYTEFTGFSQLLNSVYVRPLVEYCVLIYYFVYFAVLPRYLLNTRPKIEYFFAVFRAFFVACFVLGFVDLACSLAGINFIPRHFADAVFSQSGGRYHGIAGEPRDAFVYLFLGLAILHLHAHYKGQKLSKWWVAGIVVAALLTQSGSGFAGLLMFGVLFVFYSLRKLSLRTIIMFPIVVLGTSLVVYLFVASSERIVDYVNAASGIWDILESRREIPHLMAVQMVNIYPFYDLTVKFREYNLLPILIGSGLGSASAINNFIPGIAFNNLANPHAQIARVIYESGIIGTFIFVRIFTQPVTYVTKQLPARVRYEFMLVTLLLLGCFLGNRSSASFIYLGILIAVFRILSREGAIEVPTDRQCVEPLSAGPRPC